MNRWWDVLGVSCLIAVGVFAALGLAITVEAIVHAVGG